MPNLKQIILKVDLDEGLSKLTEEEIGYVAEFLKQTIEDARGADEMEGVEGIAFRIVEAS